METSNLVDRLFIASASPRMANYPKRGVVKSSEPFKFWRALTISGTAEATVIKFCTRAGYVKSQHMNNKSPLKGRGWGHVTHFIFWGPMMYLSEKVKARIVKFCTQVFCIKIQMPAFGWQTTRKRGGGGGQGHMTHFLFRCPQSYLRNG